MLDLKFIQFYLSCRYEKTLETYFHVSRPAISNWRTKKKVPMRYINFFIDLEKTDDIDELFRYIYPKKSKLTHE